MVFERAADKANAAPTEMMLRPAGTSNMFFTLIENRSAVEKAREF
jgi:hypothetical protein